MEQERANDDILLLDNALICPTESGGESAIESEQNVLLLCNVVPPEPVVKKIDVGPRISGFELTAARAEPSRATDIGNATEWSIIKSPAQGNNPATEPTRSPTPVFVMGKNTPKLAALDNFAQPSSGVAGAADLAHLLAEARAFASDYGVMNARTRKALYTALGPTYDLTFYADHQPEAYARLIEEAGLTIQDRAPYTPIIKLVFGADYDKARVTEFAAAIAYGRRKNLPVGTFSDFLATFDGGVKAMVALERLIRNSGDRAGADSARNEARPAVARKLRNITMQTWEALSNEGDEFALLIARRLPDGRIAMLGEVPRDVALLEKAARKLLANLERI
ncbi:hypothetical protein DXH95_07645 [Sphingorhabdus pulchriflava]|uniref:Uncharacterized protein n=1 Tax=Sphingorhabdus pulchriflava TaxID=2292257 RepID=A0A371BI35_9SPHN|nr:hypothetical protein [Sphingorhabdus pulchriflava]RDV07230.1 hypothetical protein DXH95_07645 [Sphingorhabdus pulchriflava]